MFSEAVFRIDVIGVSSVKSYPDNLRPIQPYAPTLFPVSLAHPRRSDHPYELHHDFQQSLEHLECL